MAERSIKKLRRNWSIKKDDLSKGLSKIKRSSKTLIEDVYTKEGINLACWISCNPFQSVTYATTWWEEFAKWSLILIHLSVKFSSVGRRKISLTQLLSSDNPELQKETNNTNFYIDLNQSIVPTQVCSAWHSIQNISPFCISQNAFYRSSSVLSDISETDLLSDFSASPVSSLPPSLPPSSLSTPGSAPVRPRRRSGAPAPSAPHKDRIRISLSFLLSVW